MILLLEAATASSPDTDAVVTSEGTSTYDELLEDARRVAAALRRQGITRFAVVEPDAGWVLRLLAGAALAGAEPCQYQPDTDPAEFADHASMLDHKFVVTRRHDLTGSFEIVLPESLLAAEPDEALRAGADTGQPLMIRTTGTTGLPKAARHDWRILGKTVAGVRPKPGQRWLLAYGPQQFAGVQVLLHVAACQATLVAPFPRQPKDGLRALLDDGVTCASATPTFWRFLLAEARSRKAALPPLEQITLGGEASPGDLLEEIRATFPGAKVSQVYASTEFGSITSVRDGKPGLAVASLWSETSPASNVRVADGELWVRAGAGMLGYAVEQGFAATATATDTATDGDAWRRTGDLVEIVGDRVLFRGRQSEVVNVGGVKVHPLPVEDRITALGSVAAARVFGRPSKLTGAIVAAEIVPVGGVDGADLEGIRAQIKDAVADLPRAWQPRSVTFVDAIETKGGKTIRGMEA
ncbi:MAG TPA: class I adenylate-forming enzyme family protein [Acidimicrobiales bacterium]|jgi:acyl-CoA synthetase (AMP-forming)/AMP-acid ligase II|nr:class I adenylate-forming enzyme family protein [Acidimicrobiales bacterium]